MKLSRIFANRIVYFFLLNLKRLRFCFTIDSLITINKKKTKTETTTTTFDLE